MAMTIMAVSALASAAAAGYGAYSADKAQGNAATMNAAALDQQRRQQRLQEEAAARTREGGIDARGNRTRYVPGQGMVEEASPLTRTLMGRSDQEEALRLSQDLPRQRMQREALFKQQQDERGLANSILARANVGTRSLADQEADATRLNVARAVSGPQQAERDAVITALRQGTGAEASQIAARRGARDNTRVALEEARSGAPRAFADADSARLNDAYNRYGQTMARALAVDNMPFVPNDAGDKLLAARMAQEKAAGTNLYYAANMVDPLKLQDDSGTQLARIQGALNSASGAAGLGFKAYQGWNNQPASDPAMEAIRTYSMQPTVAAHKGVF